MASNEASGSNVVASTAFDGVKTLCEDSVYLFYEPIERKPEVEVVFIHGLQFGGDSKKAYYTTWLARGGVANNCWPTTWLAGKFPKARILSLSYDANALKSATEGRMDSYLVGEKLVQEMVMDGVNIGQHGCPVVFVCHSLGGLIAKEIVVSGHRISSRNGRIGKLLCNVKAFFFYATPHRGSGVANLTKYISFLGMSPLLEILEIMNEATARLDSQFESVNQALSTEKWKFYVVGETHDTKFGFRNMVFVDEASARYGQKYLAIGANHFDVCKPKSEVDSSFQYLVECIEEVVKENRGSLLVLAEFVVDMNDRMEKLARTLEVNSIVGIVGMGGMGKTTLSKYYYNEEQRHYDRCCFLEDVKSGGNIRSFQEQMYRDLCGVKWNESKKVEDLMEEMRDCISRQKVLVVVDDVGKLENLVALQVHAFKVGRSGSKMIVTTRNRNNLLEYVISSGIMEVSEIGEEKAMELFSYYAFHDVEIEVKSQLHDQAVKIVKACGGLPLSLEVIGQYLRRLNRVDKFIGDHLRDWNRTLEKLKAAEIIEGSIDNEKLWKTLRISYDDLPEREKSLFLDFACILHQNPREDLIVRIWDSSLELQNLRDCSLIKLDDNKKSLIMHEQLRDMGKKIVEEMGGGNHWYDMSRLWSGKELKNLESDGDYKKSVKLEGLLRNIHEEDVPISRSAWKKFNDLIGQNMFSKRFPNMRLLNLEGSKLHVVKFYIGMCSKDLKWLCINNTKVTHRNLQALGSLKGLCVLQMKGCNKLKMLPHSIGNLSLLAELDLSHCYDLNCLPKSIGNLKHLQKLDLFACKGLKRLPDSIGDLSDLMELNLRGCDSLQDLPTTIGNLKHLQKLRLRECQGLKTLPDSIGDLWDLMELDLSWCDGLQDLPTTIGNLKHLQILERSFLYEIG